MEPNTNTKQVEEKNSSKTESVINDTRNIFALSREEMSRVAVERIAEITKEFTDGFKFLADYPKSVTFFGSNQFKEDNKYYADARALASRIASELNYSVASGGGPGIMEAANRGAFEVGGTSLGLTIKLPQEQVINKYISKGIDSYYFFVRKVILSFSSEALIFYPGGFGTLDEFFEIITLAQTEKLRGVPIICVGNDYWKKLEIFMVEELLSRGTIHAKDMTLFTITDNHDEIINIIKKVPVRNGMPFSLEKLGGTEDQSI